MREFNIPKLEFYKYLQIRHFLSSTDNCMRPQPTGYEILASRNPRSKKGIATIYKLLTESPITEKPAHIRKWEQEINIDLDLDQWNKMANMAFRYSKCTNHIENARKLFYRWYRTPHLLHKFYPGVSNACWRECNGIGSLTHIWWHCPKISTLWSLTETILRQATQSPLKLTLPLALLNHDLDTFPKPCQHLIFHILTAARLLIPKYWKTPQVPHKQELISLIDSNLMYEKMSLRTQQLNNNCKQSKHLWETWKESYYLPFTQQSEWDTSAETGI